MTTRDSIAQTAQVGVRQGVLWLLGKF